MNEAVADRLPGRWAIGQALGVALLAVVLVGLVAWPGATLDVLWYAVVPILPASFLVSPQLWRNVCPFSTLNVTVGERVGRRALSSEGTRLAGIVGAVLLVVLVPARILFFNSDGPVLAFTVAAVTLGAVIGGLFFDKKGGFCNSFCPVLPVERLYGQSPLIELDNPRCETCTACTRGGCMDLVPSRGAMKMLGPWTVGGRWMASPFAVFAMAFPGLVAAYYLTPATAGVGLVYGAALAGMLGSWTTLGVVFAMAAVGAERALLLCAALAVSLYYWFAPGTIAETFGFPASAVWAMRVLAFGLVAFWFTRASSARPVRIGGGAR